jgi:hypothetical protein
VYASIKISKIGSPSALSMKFPQNSGVIGFFSEVIYLNPFSILGLLKMVSKFTLLAVPFVLK